MQKLVFIFLVVLVSIGMGRICFAAPKYVRLSTLGDASTSMGIAWTTTSGTAEAVVQYGTSQQTYTKTVTGDVTYISPILGSISEVKLIGLSPGTVYYYRVGGSSGGFSPEYTFNTPPSENAQCGKMRFVVYGDGRALELEGDKGISDTWVAISAAAVLKNPDFIIHTGDVILEGKEEQQWDNYLKAAAPISPFRPLMYTIGNHDEGPQDGDNANFNKVFYLPRSETALGGSGTEDYYFFTWGNAIFISLSTESFSGGSIKFKDQADWMDQVLTQNPRRWKFVLLHRPIYTHRIGFFSLELSHPANESDQNAAFVPVINKHHIDIVFQGHNHFYERYAPSKCSDAESDTPCPVSSFDQGTVYITTGGAGAFPLWCPILCPGPIDAVRVNASSDHHYLLLDIEDHKLTMETINLGGSTIDSFTITKTIPAVDPCPALPPQDAGPTPDSRPLVDAALKDVQTSLADRKAPADTKSTSTVDQKLAITTNGGSCSCSETGQPDVTAVFLFLFLFLAMGLLRAMLHSSSAAVISKSL